MNTPSTSTNRLSAADPTLELSPSTPAPVATSVASASQHLPCARVALVEGTAPHLTGEIQGLLRRRLRLAVGVFAAGFAIFLVSHALQADYRSPVQVFLLGFHAVVALVLGALAGLLWHRCVISLAWLRVVELGVFGLPALFFLVFEYFATLAKGEKGFFDFDAGVWLLLMFNYALFIPNTLRRAAVVIGLMALAPVVLLFAMLAAHPQLVELATIHDLTGFPLVMLISAVAGVLGVDTIGSLRREAFEARQLGQYRLKQRIGAGGMGEVYLAEHQLLKRPCVLKLIRPDKTGDCRLLARFEREVRSTARLSHWNTVEIFDYGSTEDGTFYYVMEYLPGMSLAELVERFGPLPAERAIYLLRQVCEALGEAHAMGLIHRDIKPGNIFAAIRGGVYDVAKLLDFGLVKPLMDDQPVQLTTEGTITGSPLFMSPEQATGDADTDARGDVYSLGAVAFYLVTGRPPFEADKAIKVMFAHAHQAPRPPSELCPDVPADLEAVILRCLSKAPADRYASVEELNEALAACQSADGWSRQLAAQWWQKHRGDIHACA